MTRSLTFLFSGQGSQYFQMGRELYLRHPVYRRVFGDADALLQAHWGICLRDELFRHSYSEGFDDLRVSQAALLVVQYAVFRTLLSEGIKPDRVLGSSFGEYIAAVAAGIWKLETALEITMEQASLVEARCPPGAMFAIFSDARLIALLQRAGHEVTLAGVNFSNHCTIAVGARSIEGVQTALKAAGVIFQRLPVRYPFHSAAIDPIKDDFVRYCMRQSMNRPRPPLVSVATCDVVREMAPDHFWSVARGPMRFRETVLRLEGEAPSIYIDCGPSGTLATFVKYNLDLRSTSLCVPILTAFHRGMEQIETLKAQLSSP